jgi:flagellar biosynthesis protein
MKKEKNKNEMILEAAALKYDASSDNAPYIIALGKGLTADKMVEAARENNVQIVKDEKLSHMLGKLNVGDEIPEQLYAVVAEILVFISSIDNDYKRKFGV